MTPVFAEETSKLFVTIQDYLSPMQFILLLIALIALFQTRRNLRENTITMLAERMFEINKLEFETPDLFSALNDDKLYEVNKEQMKHYLFMLFSFYEQLYYMRTDYQDEMTMVWNARLRYHLLNRRNFRKYWEEVFRFECTSGFRHFIENRIMIGDRMEIPHSCTGCFILRFRRWLLLR